SIRNSSSQPPMKTDRFRETDAPRLRASAATASGCGLRKIDVKSVAASGSEMVNSSARLEAGYCPPRSAGDSPPLNKLFAARGIKQARPLLSRFHSEMSVGELGGHAAARRAIEKAY